MFRRILKKSVFERFDKFVDVMVYDLWMKRYQLIKLSGRQPFMPDMPEKYFSQNDEDGYTIKICERFNDLLSSFVEIGVGNGLENNTILLRANGFKGLWIDALKLPKQIRLNSKNNEFRFIQSFVTPDGVNDVIDAGLSSIELEDFDVLSLDIDGDDFNVMDQITDKYHPKLIIAEINTKLGPTSPWNYSTSTSSTPGGDNFGVSFKKLTEMLHKKNYAYLAMNAATGLNAFYISLEHKNLFPELDNEIGFVPPFYRWPRHMYGNSSYSLVSSILNGTDKK